MFSRASGIDVKEMVSKAAITLKIIIATKTARVREEKSPAM